MAGSANIAFSVDFSGDRELMRKLDKLADKTGRNVLRKAVRAGATPIVKEAKARAPVQTGADKNLKKSIGKRMRWYNGSQTMVAVVGPRIKYARNKVTKQLLRNKKGGRISVLAGQHGYILEFGTKPRYTKSGAFRGVGPARPFMRPAWDSRKKEAEKIAVKRLLEEVEKEGRRGG